MTGPHVDADPGSNDPHVDADPGSNDPHVDADPDSNDPHIDADPGSNDPSSLVWTDGVLRLQLATTLLCLSRSRPTPLCGRPERGGTCADPT